MSDESKGLLIKYGTYTLFLIIGIIMFFIGLLNGGVSKESDLIFNMIFITGFLLSGASTLAIFMSLMDDF